MRNNSLAMIGTIAAVGILAWWLGFFDPSTCIHGNQQAGWTSCEAIAQERAIALWVLVGAVVVSVVVWLLRRRK
ncbi:MAG: hypothetical protein F2536_01090 [Actinobacteria bacterium]|uniref:Unannotated protein n=1 Tax=freshwater metagenome TaxID=449393 RepID=A0A6J6BPX3_9ZZZZ|nr:hypothetical protein [Actinomycetota bacterium]MTA89508.1 hypothetical protein [Actinomycetota bacterium]